MPYLGSESYLAIAPEASEGDAVTPTIFVPLVSENITPELNHEPDRRMKGNSWKSDDMLRGARNYTGEITILADADNLGHILNMGLEKGETTGSAENGWIHQFSNGNAKSYTIEIKKGDSVRRFFGVKARSIRLEFVDGKLQATVSIGAMGQFAVGTLKTALSGASTELELDTKYDLKPIDGLVVGDKIEVGGVKVTITGFDDNTKVQFSSTSITASAGASVKLVPQTPTYTGLEDPLMHGNALIGVGENETAATTAAGSKATATPFYTFTINLGYNLLDAPASGSIDPIKLLPQVKEAQISSSALFEDIEQYQKFVDRTKQAITMIVLGQPIGTGQEKFQIKFYKVKHNSLENPLEAEGYIYDNSEFEVLYDSTDGALDIELVNHTAASEY